MLKFYMEAIDSKEKKEVELSKSCMELFTIDTAAREI